jgi:hypothetical protein
VDVAARHEILLADLAGRHPGDAEDQVARLRGGPQVFDGVDDAVALAGELRPERGLIAIDPGEVRKTLLIASRPAGERTRTHIHDATKRRRHHRNPPAC